MPLILRDIDYVLAVARRGALSAAADELGVTQPTLTKAVQRVEAEFGVRLFERTARGMVLTAAGQRAAEQLRRLATTHADTVRLADEMRAQQAGLLRVGVTDASAESPLVQAITALLAQRPALRLRLAHGRSDMLADLVQAGELDAALIPVYEGQTLPGTVMPIRNDPMQLVVRRGHPLAGRSRLGLADLVPFGWIIGSTGSVAYRVIEARFAARGLPAPHAVLEVPYTSGLSAEVLARSDLVSLIPTSFLRHADASGQVVLSVPELSLKRVVALVTRGAAPEVTPLLEALRAALLRRPRAGSQGPSYYR